MADAIVTFCSVYYAEDKQHLHAPIARGSSARTVSLTLDTAPTVPATDDAAAEGEDTIRVYAQADLYVAVGSDPDPEGEGAWFVAEGTDIWLKISEGESVSVVGLS